MNKKREKKKEKGFLITEPDLGNMLLGGLADD